MLEARYRDALSRLTAEHRLRSTRAFGPARPGFVELGGRELLDVSSNDYLGLSRHPECARRACDFALRFGTGAAASRLIRGTSTIHEALEARLADMKGAQAALVMGSGFQTNASVLATLLASESLVFSDKLNHASMHEGCRQAGVRQIRYRHLDCGHLEDLLRKHADKPGPRFILSETVFSMDGDRADVAGLANLATKFGAFLYLDEAHAVGVLGPHGHGLAAGVPMESGLVMGTFSKALGSYGGYVCCSSVVREYLVNRCAGFIFSTALPPPVLGAVDAALDLLPAMDPERAALQDLAQDLRRQLSAAGCDPAGSSTQIIPVMVGSAAKALAAMRALEEEGILAVAVRPPTVPPGASRLRLSLSAAHGPDVAARLAEAIPRVLERLR